MPAEVSDVMIDPVSPAIRQVLELFATDLASVQFGGIEGSVLATAAQEVEAAADEARQAEAMLEEARADLASKQEALLVRAQRALAYARVYAEDDTALAARVDGITLARPARRAPRADELPAAPADPAARRRGRPRKAEAGAQLLELPEGTREAAMARTA